MKPHQPRNNVRRTRILRSAVERLEPRALLSGTISYTVPNPLDHTLLLSVVQVNAVPTVQLVDNNLVVAEQPLAATTSVSVVGAGGQDTLTVDFAGGSPLPAGGLSFDGGGGSNNRMILVNGSFANEAYSAGGAASGTITLDGASIAFANVGAVTDTVNATSLTFTATGAQQQLNVVNGADFGGLHTTQFNGGASPAFASLDFANKTDVKLEAGTADNSVLLSNSVAAANLASFTLDTQTGADVVDVWATPAGVPTYITSFSSFTNGADEVMIGHLGSVQAVLGSLDVSIDPMYADVVIDDSADALARTCTYTGTSVTGLAPAAITWTPSDIGTVTVNGGTGGNNFTVASTVFGSVNTLNTGAGNDVVTIQSVSGGSTLNVNGQSGNDRVTVVFGVFDSSAGSLAGFSTVLGPLNVTNASGTTALALDATSQPGDQAVTMGGTSVSLTTSVPQGPVTETVTFNLGNGGALTVLTGAGTDTFDVTPSATVTMNIDAGDPAAAPGDTLNLNLANLSGATLSALAPAGFDHAYSFANAMPVNFAHVETWTPVAVAPSPVDLSLAFTGQARVNENAKLTYSFTVTNLGAADAADVTLTDVIPSGITFKTSSVAATSLNGNTLVIHLGTLAAGATRKGTLTFTAGDDGVVIANTLTLAGSTPDPVPSNNSQTVSTTIVDPPVQVTGGFTFSLTEGVSSGALKLATFVDPAGAEPLSNYSATIHWGDGSTSAGAIAAGPDGVFVVSGSHTYLKDGTRAVSVTVSHGTARDASARSTAQVFDPPVVLTAAPASAGVEGASATITLATFTDPGGALSPGNYNAVVDWGDGTTSAATVRRGTSAGSFVVTGAHRFADEGTYHPTVTVSHGTAAPGTAVATINVADAPIGARGNLTLAAQRGTQASFTVATFTDPGGAEDPAVPGHYAATIKWGDGSTSPGTITYDAKKNTFSVAGAHAYQTTGSFTVTVSIVHNALPAVTVNDVAKVTAKAANAPAPAANVAATPTAFSDVLVGPHAGRRKGHK